MRTQVGEKFRDFYEKWMGQLEKLLQILIRDNSLEDEGRHEAMVSKLTAHHEEYYTFKWDVAHEDVLSFFTPIWLSPLENVYLWITGWKPSTAFCLIESLRKAQKPAGASLSNLTDEQVKKIDGLRMKIKEEEESVESEMGRLQVTMADRKMVELARMDSRVTKSGAGPEMREQVNDLVEVALTGLLDGLEKVMKMADCLRLKTVKGLLDVLKPEQRVDFLAATSMLQIQMGRLGKKERKMLSCSCSRGELDR